MNKPIKFLTLVLATLLLTASIFACTKTPPTTTAVPAPAEPIVGREGMTPAEIGEILPHVEWVQIQYELHDSTQDTTNLFVKDGAKIYHEHDGTAGFTSIFFNRYVDCATGTYYEGKYHEKGWFTRPGSKDFWMETLNEIFYKDERLSTALTVGAYDGSMNGFPSTVKSANFKSEGTTYTFFFEMEDAKQADFTATAKFTISFERQTVTLPTEYQIDPAYTEPVSDHTPVRIYVETEPNKTGYHIGESLDTTGGIIVCQYADGTSSSFPLTNAHILSLKPFSASGHPDITVQYTENGVTCTTTFMVTVFGALEKIELIEIPKTVYRSGEPLDIAGGSLYCFYDDHTTRHIDLLPAYVFGFEKIDGPGVYTLTVKYAENGILCSTSYEITVID